MANEFYQDDDKTLWERANVAAPPRYSSVGRSAASTGAPQGSYGAAPLDDREVGQALRYNHDKAQLSYVPWEQMYATARGMQYGAKKYARNNFRNGFKMESVTDSLLRHVFALLKGELIDEESGLSHVDLINCNAAFLAVGTVAGWEWESHTKEVKDGK